MVAVVQVGLEPNEMTGRAGHEQAMTKELGAMETDEGADHKHQGTGIPWGQSGLQGSVPDHLVGQQDPHHCGEHLRKGHGSKRRSLLDLPGTSFPLCIYALVCIQRTVLNTTL